ncbi:hypothetical protein [Pantoea agglomerans]|uniref:hypothetical protein n=1 Tax=Enterobacter agglomerans TaxID=549 RepID=UPI0030159D60
MKSGVPFKKNIVFISLNYREFSRIEILSASPYQNTLSLQDKNLADFSMSATLFKT